jgi:hypothetical protein
MTLHETTILAKKISKWAGITFGCLFGIFILFQLGVIIKNMIFPPKVVPPSVTYGKVPAIAFPTSIDTQPLTYSLNTLSGDLPVFPNRLNIYPITHPPANFLNLNKVKGKAARLGFSRFDGTVLPEQSLGNEEYRWTEEDGIKRRITFNIVSFNFHMESDYLTSLTVLDARNLGDEKKAAATAKGFLDNIALTPSDLAIEKTTTPFQNLEYITNPQLFAIKNSQLAKTTSLATTQVIRVDLYQKDVSYELNTGVPALNGNIIIETVTLPILYPHPPYSTMTFWVASTDQDIQVVEAKFTHHKYTMPTDVDATYPIKTAEEALEELKNGKGYVASYAGSANEIKINNIFLAYYAGETEQNYLMPIIVFQGNNGFFAYVSALRDEWITKP